MIAIGPAGFMAGPRAEPAVHDGDLAEYSGTHKALAGLRCEVGAFTQTGKRVRCTVRLPNGHVVVRLIKPDNLKKVGGGVTDA